MPCNALYGTDSILLYQEFADPYYFRFRKMFVIQRCKQGLRECMVAVEALVQLVSGTVLSPPYYFLAPFPVEIAAAVILACNRILAPWP